MSNRSVSFRSIVMGLVIIAIGVVSASANWIDALQYLLPQETVSAAELRTNDDRLGGSQITVAGSTGADGGYTPFAAALAGLKAKPLQTS